MVAVVDDDEAFRGSVKRLLEALGYRVAAFRSAKDFLSSKHRHRSTCLIADVQMPEMTGPELHKRLMASGNAIPTILVTAYPDEVVRTRALQAGIRCYLTKPFGEDDLLACLRRLHLGSSSGDHPVKVLDSDRKSV